MKVNLQHGRRPEWNSQMTVFQFEFRDSNLRMNHSMSEEEYKLEFKLKCIHVTAKRILLNGLHRNTENITQDLSFHAQATCVQDIHSTIRHIHALYRLRQEQERAEQLYVRPSNIYVKI